LVLDLDAAYFGNSFEALSEADKSQELTCVDIDTFLAIFKVSATQVGTGASNPLTWGAIPNCRQD
jgi:hypothetical protein